IETELNTASLQTSDSHSLSGDRKMNNESDLNESEVDSTRLEEGEKDPSIVDDGAVQVKSENNNQLPNAQAAPFTFAAVNSQYSQAEATAFDDSSDDTDLTLSTNDQAGMPSQEFQLLSSIRDAQQVDTKVNTPLENANQATSSTGEVSDLATINSMSQEQLIVPVDSDTQDNMQSMSDSSITLATANGQTIPSQQAQVLTNIDDVQLTSNSTITLATDNGQTMPSQQAQLLSTGRDGQPVNSINTENGIDAVSDSFTTGTKSANQASSHNALQAQQVVSEGDNKVGLPLTQKTEQLTKNEQSNELSDSISEESVALVDQDSAPTALKMEGQATAQSIVDVNGAKPIQTSVIQSDKLVSMNQHMQATNNLLQEPLDIHSKQAAQIMGERVMMMLSEGKQEVQIRLDPAELGSMFIKVQVQQDQVQLHIQTQAGLSKDIIDQNMPRLREQLAQQGIQLSEANVEQQSQQHQQSGQQQSTQTMNSRNTHNTDVIDDNSTAIWMPSKIASNEQGIDYYA
ncbi:MAG: flagellar hook-length control protein FliK, partial [Psychromonas sp.]